MAGSGGAQENWGSPVEEGCQKSDSPRWTADRYHLRPMVWSVLYLVLRRLIGRSGGGSSSVTSKEVEIAVLRHQLNILRRQMRRPRLGLGDPASPEPRSIAGRAKGAGEVLDPRSRLEVLRSLRRGVPNRGHGADPHPVPGSTRERLCRAVGAISARRVPRLDSDLGAKTPRACPSPLRNPLQPSATSSRARPRNSRATSRS